MLPFVPHQLPIQNLNFERLMPFVGRANSALSNYNGLLQHVINPFLFKPLALKEAVLSSKIEGTQASFEEVLEKDSNILDQSESIDRDIEEIDNYTKALEYGVMDLKNRPLCLNMIKDMHYMLLDGVRGNGKARGELRRIQNYIGSHGARIEQATYVPPDPMQMMTSLDQWEKYLYNEDQEMLVQLAVIHAQFEIIHPFLDGNGRLGRILIPLFLYSKNYLNEPVFYLSEFLEAHRSDYYYHLLEISKSNKWQEWIEFFLQAVMFQSQINVRRIKKILSLYEKTKDTIARKNIPSKYAFKVIDLLFEKPILTALDLVNKGVVPNKVSAIRILTRLVEVKILELRAGSGSRSNAYFFTELLEVIESV